MDLLASARKRIVEFGAMAVGGHGSGDPVLEQCRSKLCEMQLLVTDFRTDLGRYADSVLGMVSLSEKVSTDIGSLYKRSESRQKSISRFVDVGKRIGGSAHDIFRSQFQVEIVGMLDMWLQQIESMKSRVESADRFLVKLERKEHSGDPSTEPMRRDFERAKAQLAQDVKRRVDERFSVFDSILVRLMECQIEFFTASSEAVKLLTSNVDNYRKRFPRGTTPKVLLADKARQSVTGIPDNIKAPSDKTQQNSAKHNHHHHHHHHRRHRSPATESEESEESEDSYDSESESEDDAHANASPPPPVAATTAAEPIDLLNGFDMPETSSSHTEAFDFMGNDTAVEPVPQTMDELFGMTSSGVSNSAPTSNGSGVDAFDPYDIGTTQAHSSPTSNDSHGFAMFDPMAGSGQPNDTAVAPSSSGGQTKKTTAKPRQKPRKAPSAADSNMSLRDRIAQNQNSKVQNMRDHLNAEEQLQAAKREAADGAAASLDKWEYKDGVRRPIRTLLTSMHTVLWEDSGFKMVKLSDVVTESGVKKAYRRALLVVHPDKVKGSDPNKHAIAERIFDALTIQFKQL